MVRLELRSCEMILTEEDSMIIMLKLICAHFDLDVEEAVSLLMSNNITPEEMLEITI